VPAVHPAEDPHDVEGDSVTVMVMKIRASRKRLGRVAAVSALGAAAFAGLAATPAQAATNTWATFGPIRATDQQARADEPATEAACRRQDGYVRFDGIITAFASGKDSFQAFTVCVAK
jgi:hypothetical protein